MNAAAPAVAALRWTPRRLSGPSLLLCLGALLMLTLLWAAGQGAYSLPLSELPGVLLGAVTTTAPGGSGAELVFFNIRLPRLVLGLAAGAGLGLAGALMQGLFRNPLADPGLIGVSSGAALAAGATIVMGNLWFPDLPRSLGSWTLVLMAFGGGLAVTVLIYLLSRGEGGTRVGLMLLAGIAVNALAGAGLGLLVSSQPTNSCATCSSGCSAAWAARAGAPSRWWAASRSWPEGSGCGWRARSTRSRWARRRRCCWACRSSA